METPEQTKHPKDPVVEVTLTTAANGTDSYAVYLVTPLERSSDTAFTMG